MKHKDVQILKILRLSSYFLIYSFFLLYSCQKMNINRDATSEDKKVIRFNCYECHAPVANLEGSSLKKIYFKFGDKKLVKFLKNEFNNHCTIEEHCSIKLNRQEIESVGVFIKKMALPGG